MTLATDAASLNHQISCNQTGVEGFLLDSDEGTLVTLINWTNSPKLEKLEISVRLPTAPREVYSVSNQKQLEFEFSEGKLNFSTELTAGDFLVLKQ